MNWKIFCLIFLFLFFISPRLVWAIYDPKSVDNNRIGIHIFDPNEIDTVAPLVNNNGGEWGYITVVIRDDQKDKAVWDHFMKKCREYKLIPIVRLATHMTNNGWAKPSNYTIIDLANFLNDLDWPTKNRYIVVFNEPNHANEWGNDIDPEGYAEILVTTSITFKDRSQDFFILPAGLDNAAPNASGHMRWDTYLQRMFTRYPNLLEYIDGWTAHSYPNHAFSGSPHDTHDHSIVAYKIELNFLRKFGDKKLPVFITETGWSNRALSDETIASYYEIALKEIWNDDNIVAITPFVLFAGDGPFQVFSLKNADGNPKPQYNVIKDLPKKAGKPQMNDNKPSKVLGAKIENTLRPPEEGKNNKIVNSENITNFLEWIAQ